VSLALYVLGLQLSGFPAAFLSLAPLGFFAWFFFLTALMLRRLSAYAAYLFFTAFRGLAKLFSSGGTYLVSLFLGPDALFVSLFHGCTPLSADRMIHYCTHTIPIVCRRYVGQAGACSPEAVCKDLRLKV
jgi:hypothetical protein